MGPFYRDRGKKAMALETERETAGSIYSKVPLPLSPSFLATWSKNKRFPDDLM